MNRFFAVFVLGVCTVAAQTPDQPVSNKDKKTSKKKTTAAAVKAAKPTPPVAQPLTIPKDAVANADGTYAYTDKSGKKWIFSKTPFGVSRTEDMSGVMKGASVGDPAQYLTAFDSGDSVKFERKTPFGVSKWEKKKIELTDEERAALARTAAQPEQKPE